MHCIIKFLGIGFSLILNNVKNSKVKTQKWKKDSVWLAPISRSIFKKYPSCHVKTTHFAAKKHPSCRVKPTYFTAKEHSNGAV
jgi:hypothetical protein